MQRIDIGDQVSADAIGVNQFDDRSLLGCLRARFVRAGQKRIAIDRPTQRLMRNAKVGKDIVVETMFPD